MRKNLCWILLVILVAVSCWSYPLGYSVGQIAGYEAGYEAGYGDVEIECQDAYACGYRVGVENGVQSGVFNLLCRTLPMVDTQVKDFEVYSNGKCIWTVSLNDTGLTYIFVLDCCGYICD